VLEVASSIVSEGRWWVIALIGFSDLEENVKYWRLLFSGYVFIAE
jgi:hypothetical protein